jgi:hypothetical protein
MLLARSHGKAITTPFIGINGLTHDTPGHLAQVFVLNTHKAQIRAAVTQRASKGLSLANDYIGSQLARRGQRTHGQSLGDDDYQKPFFAMDYICQDPQVFYPTEKIRVLNNQARRVIIKVFFDLLGKCSPALFAKSNLCQGLRRTL